MGLFNQAGRAACQLIDDTNRMYTPQNRIVFTILISILPVSFGVVKLTLAFQACHLLTDAHWHLAFALQQLLYFQHLQSHLQVPRLIHSCQMKLPEGYSRRCL